MAKTRANISLPKELKARMDLVNADGWVVNWSEVAQNAFERELRKHERKRMKENEMNAVIERLRESREDYVKGFAELGLAAGRDWAQHRADYVELKRLGEVGEFSTNVSCIDIARIAQGIDDSGFSDNADALENMGITDPDHLGSEEFACGFVDGALEVWEQVKDQI